MSTAAPCDKSIPNVPCATRAPRILSFDYHTLDEALSPIRQVKTAGSRHKFWLRSSISPDSGRADACNTTVKTANGLKSLSEQRWS